MGPGCRLAHGPGPSRPGFGEVRRLHARDPLGWGGHGPAHPGVKLAFRRHARSGDLDREGDGLRPEHEHDLEPAGVVCGVRPLGRHARSTLCGPTSWAHTTARLQSETERSLADEAGGPLAQLLAVPQDGGDGGDDDPLTALKADIRTARGKALLVERAAAGWGEGRQAARQKDWQASRLGPMMPESMVKAADGAFQRVLSACGVPPPLFLDSDGTSQREAVRRWHMNTVQPLARLVEHELTAKLETAVKLTFDTYALDMVSRAQVVAKLTAAGVALSVALEAVGLGGDA